MHQHDSRQLLNKQNATKQTRARPPVDMFDSVNSHMMYTRSAAVVVPPCTHVNRHLETLLGQQLTAMHDQEATTTESQKVTLGFCGFRHHSSIKLEDMYKL
jgi:hypothetical protein